MRKKLTMMVCAIVLSMAMSIPAWAEQWISDGYGWKWMNDNGSFSVNTWQWIDGNYDGIAECYCFNPWGYCLLNTITPDGHMVNASGAWTVNGVVQILPTFLAQNQVVNNAVAPVDVLALETVDENTFYVASEGKTTQGQTWLNAGCFFHWVSAGPSYAEYYIGAQYTTLSFVYAPESGMNPKYTGIFKVYGDNDKLLWESGDINYKTSAQNASVNISGQQYIKFILDSGYYSGNVLVKDVFVQ